MCVQKRMPNNPLPKSVPPVVLSILVKWQLHLTTCSAQTFGLTLTPGFLSYSICSLLTNFVNCALKIYPEFHHCSPPLSLSLWPRFHHLFPTVLQQPYNCSLCFYPCFSTILSEHSNQSDPFKCKLYHASSLLKTL